MMPKRLGRILSGFIPILISVGTAAGQAAPKDCDTVKAFLDSVSVGDKMDALPFESSGLPQPKEIVFRAVFSGCSMELHIDTLTSSVKSKDFVSAALPEAVGKSETTVATPEGKPSGSCLGAHCSQTAPAKEQEKSPAWRQHDWKAGTVSDISQTTGQQRGILTGDMNTIDTWTYTILGYEGTYTVREEIMRGLVTGHAPLTRTEGTEVPYYRDGAYLVVAMGLRGKGKNERPVTSKYVIVKFSPK